AWSNSAGPTFSCSGTTWTASGRFSLRARTETSLFAKEIVVAAGQRKPTQNRRPNPPKTGRLFPAKPRTNPAKTPLPLPLPFPSPLPPPDPKPTPTVVGEHNRSVVEIHESRR